MPKIRFSKVDLKVIKRWIRPFKKVPVLGVLIIVFALAIAWFGNPSSTKTVNQIKKTIKKIELPGLTDITISEIPVLKSNASKSNIKSHNAILIDVNSGYMMDGIDELKPVPIASLTKLMTALLTIESQPLDKKVTVPKLATEVIGSKINLKTDEQLTVKDLLYALLLNSANDAAYTLASIDGPVDQFIIKMNSRAIALGLNNTHFKDPAGLDDEGYSSARDIGLLTSYVYRHEELSDIAKTPKAQISSVDGKLVHQLENSDRLVKDELYVDGIIGGKTGFTPSAGHNLTAMAQQNGHRIVAVIINTYDPAKSASAVEAKKYLTWGFSQFDWKKISP